VTEFEAPELFELISMLLIWHLQHLIANRNLPGFPGFRQGCHADHVPAVVFDKATQIRKRPAKPDMVVNEKIVSAGVPLAGK
jgi:hypothetical protein